MNYKEVFDKSILPSTIEEAVTLLEPVFKRLKKTIETDSKITETVFLDSVLLTMGLFIRDIWFLDWSKRNAALEKRYPEEQPDLQKVFTDLGIFSSIDMAEIIILLLFQTYKFGEYDKEEIINRYV